MQDFSKTAGIYPSIAGTVNIKGDFEVENSNRSLMTH